MKIIQGIVRNQGRKIGRCSKNCELSDQKENVYELGSPRWDCFGEEIDPSKLSLEAV